MRPNVRFRLIGRVNTWFELISLNHPEPRLLKSQVSRPPQPAKNDIMFIAIILSSFILVNSICLLGVFLPSKTMVRLFPSAPLSGPMRRLPPCSCSFLLVLLHVARSDIYFFRNGQCRRIRILPDNSNNFCSRRRYFFYDAICDVSYDITANFTASLLV